MHDHASTLTGHLEKRYDPSTTGRHTLLVLLALALGTFAIGSGRFGSNGIVQAFLPPSSTCRCQ